MLPLRVLIIEDSGLAAKALVRELKRGGYEPVVERVQTSQTLLDALDRQSWDVVLSDHVMPNFDAFEAIRVLRQRDLDLPFIVVSGAINEATAIALMRAGAQDFVFKDQYGRLIPIIERELREALSRRERRRAEEALRQSEERLKLVLEGSQDGFWDQNLVTGETYYSLRWIEMLGYQTNELTPVDQTWTALVHEADRAAVLQARQDHLEGRTPFFAVENRMRTSGGRWRWMLVRGKVVNWDSQGKPIRMTGTQTDITERKNAEDYKTKLETQLRQAQKMEAIGTLAGGIAHDFNNILGIIIPYIDLAQIDAVDNQQVQSSLSEIRKAAHRAKDLVKQILAFSRQTKYERQPMLLQPVIKEVLKMLRSTIPATIEIVDKVQPSAPRVLADPVQIHQVLMNLCTNAAHAMRAGTGRMEIELDLFVADELFAQQHGGLPPGRYAKLMVSDTGHGMDDATLKRLFEPFFTTKPLGEGTGLGLAVVHGIVQEHKGGIFVYSQPGKGTVFHVFFPACVTQRVEMDQDRPAVELPHGNGERILFVDDEKRLAEITKAYLTRFGYQVTSCNAPVDALNEFCQNPRRYDLVITDLTMPRMTGMDFAQSILAVRADIPILLATGFSGAWSRKQVRQLGISDLLLKPVTPTVLIKAIHQALQEKSKKNFTALPSPQTIETGPL